MHDQNIDPIKHINPLELRYNWNLIAQFMYQTKLCLVLNNTLWPEVFVVQYLHCTIAITFDKQAKDQKLAYKYI